MRALSGDDGVRPPTPPNGTISNFNNQGPAKLDVNINMTINNQYYFLPPTVGPPQSAPDALLAAAAFFPGTPVVSPSELRKMEIAVARGDSPALAPRPTAAASETAVDME